MVSALEKAYESYEDNGGQVAITGFNFQAYSGIYHMLYLHKNNKKFKISFEVDDDLVIKNLTDNKSFKIQVKSENLTRGKLVVTDKNDRCLLGKIIYKGGYDYYILSFPSETASALKKVGIIRDTLIGGDCYEYNHKHDGTKTENKECENINNLMSEKCFQNRILIFQEMPFNKISNNCYMYLFGYANSSENNEIKLAMSKEQLLALLGTIYNQSSKKIIPKELDNNIIKEMEACLEEEKIIEEHLEMLKDSRTPVYKKNLIANRGNYEKEKIYYDKILNTAILPVFDDEVNFIKYFDECLELIDKALTSTLRVIINKYIRAWFIINKMMKGESNYDC